MKAEFEKLAAAGKIEGRHVAALTQLAEAGCCTHRSWGFGRIKTVDTVFARFTIDFPGKPGHAMDLSFSAESLKPVPKDHILARKAMDLEAVRHLAAHHLDLIKIVLNSYGGKATPDQIQSVLVPDVIADDWKKWWETAKCEMKKNGHFIVPLKKTEPVVYQVKETSLQDRLLAEFRAAKGLKARILVVAEMLKGISDLKDKVATANEVIAALNPDIVAYQRTQPSVALEVHHDREAWLALTCPAGLEQMAQAALRTAYPNCRLRRAERSPGAPPCVLRLKKHAVFTKRVKLIDRFDPDRPMRDHHHDGAALARRANRPRQRLIALGIEIGVRLVEHDQIRIAKQRLGDPEPLFHAMRKCFHAIVRPILKPDQRH